MNPRARIKELGEESKKLRLQGAEINRQQNEIADEQGVLKWKIIYGEKLLASVPWQARAYWRDYDDSSWITLHTPRLDAVVDILGMGGNHFLPDDGSLGIHFDKEVWIGAYSGASTVLDLIEKEGLDVDMSLVAEHLAHRESLLDPLREALQRAGEGYDKEVVG